MMKLLPSLRNAVLMSTAIATLAFSHSASAEALRLNFGVYSSNKPSAMVRIFKPTLNELEARMTEKLGRQVDIRMQIAKDYDQGISHLTTGKVDFSRFGPAPYIEAKKMNEGIEILAMESKDGEKVFYGIIATKDDSNIQSVEDLRGRSFAFGDEGSTIGRFLSQLYLEQNNIRADDLSKYEYLGRHDLVGTAVGAGDFAAGALNESTYNKLIEAGEPLRTVAKFPNVTKPWIARSGLDPVIFEALQLSLLEITDEKALKGLKAQGFLSGDDTDYAVIREAMDFNFKFFEKPVKEAVETAKLTPASSPVEEVVVEDVVASETPKEAIDKAKVASIEKTPVVTETSSSTSDQSAIAAATSVLADQVSVGEEPTIGSAMPTATSAGGAISAAQQENANLAARALAIRSAQSAALQSHSQVNTTPSAYAINGNNLTINIALPQQLMNRYEPGNNQNITINLTFPANQSPEMQSAK